MAGHETDMVLELLRAIRRHRTYEPARLSPTTEAAYLQAESMRHAATQKAA